MSTQGSEHEHDRDGADEERQRREREAALRALAGQPQPTPSAAPTLTHALPPMGAPRGRTRPLLLALLIACVVIVGGLGWWHFSHRSSNMPTTGPLTLKFPDAHILCPESVDWSPDGKQVTISGDSGCPNVPPNPQIAPDPQVEIYDTSTWRVVKAMHLLPLAEATRPQVISPNRHPDAATLAKVAVRVAAGVGWSPDGQQMTVGFALDASALVATGDASVPQWIGSLSINAQTFSVATTLEPQPAAPVAPSFEGPYSSYQPAWVRRDDLLTGAASFFMLPQALAYRWDAQDRLEATEPLPAWDSTPAVPPLGPVGQPIGGASFMIWQQAVVSQATTYAYGCTAPYFPVTIQLSARSPDGRYIVEGLTINARFPAPADAIPTPPIDIGTPGSCPPLPTKPTEDNSTAPNFVAPLPIRDAGLAAALKTFAGEPFTGALTLAWSPDGQRLAVEERVRPETPAGHFTIYDCASGKALKQYTVDQLDPTFDQINVTPLRLSWSPDSKQLLVYDEHRIVVLSGATLGG